MTPARKRPNLYFYAASGLWLTSAIAALRSVASWCSRAPSGSLWHLVLAVHLLPFDGSAPRPSRSRSVIGSRMAGARRAAVLDASRGRLGAAEGTPERGVMQGGGIGGLLTRWAATGCLHTGCFRGGSGRPS